MRHGLTYTNEEIYRIVLMGQLHPACGIGGESFWKRMLERYGKAFFFGRTAAGLRQKWRTLTNEHPLPELLEENRKLGEEFGKFMLKNTTEDGGSRRETNIAEEISELPTHHRVSQVIGEAPHLDSVGSKFSFGTHDIGVSADFASTNEIEHEEIKQMCETSKKNDKIQNEETKQVSRFCEQSVQCDPMETLSPESQFPPILSIISEDYSLSNQQVLGLLHQLSGNVANLEMYLKGEQVPIWTELEDLALQAPYDSAVYKYLIGSKGAKEIEERKKYLGIS